MRRFNCWKTFVVAAATVTGLAGSAWAVPYASGIRNSSGNTWEFVLNQSADSVTVLRNGANPVNLGGIGAGRHTFDMTGFTTFDIEVTHNNATAWAEISSPTNAFTKFNRPNGLEVNTNPASPYFGTVYVVNSNAIATTSPVRTMGDGVYALTADLIGVDPATKAAIADPNDTTLQGKSFSWTVAGSDTASAFRLGLDEAGNLIVSDWSDVNGGVKYAMADLSSGGLILANEDGIRPLLVNANNQEVHGSIVSKPYVTGSVGNNLVLYGMDEDYDLDGDTITASTGNHIWKWNVGNATDYDEPPQLHISSSALTVNTPDPTNPHPKWLNLNVGVDANMFYSPIHDKWYLTQNRNDGTEGGLIVVTADGVDGTTPTIDWSSIQWTYDNNLDSYPDDADPLTLGDNGKNDAFRGLGSAVVSPDGKFLYIHRRQVVGNAAGPPPVISLYTGQSSNLAGNVLVIPLDANGVPIININDNGTPLDSADDTFTNLQSITIAGNNTNKGSHEITLDAAGNVYIASNAAASQSLQVFSPAGNFKATTSSDGTFDLLSLTVGVAGDYNGNGIVDAADYTEWRDNFGGTSLPNEGGISPGTVDQADYNFWKSRFGATSGSGGGAGIAAPEPGAALLMAAGLMFGWLSGVRRRQPTV